MVEAVATENTTENIFAQEVGRGINFAYRLIDERYGPSSKDVLIFHSVDHSRDVVRRILKIGRVVRRYDPTFTDCRLQLTMLMGAWHDVVQNRKEEIPNQGIIEEGRNRDRGNNEENSGKELIDYMMGVNQERGMEVFTEGDFGIVRLGMWGTIPDFQEGTIIQPYINGDSPYEVIILGLADIGGAGIDGAEQFIREGNNEFRELFTGITRGIKEGGLSEEEKGYAGIKMREWITMDQISFVEGRERNFDEEAGHFNNPQITEALKNEVFTKFEESKNAVRKRADGVLNNTSFEELSKLIGYVT